MKLFLITALLLASTSATRSSVGDIVKAMLPYCTHGQTRRDVKAALKECSGSLDETTTDGYYETTTGGYWTTEGYWDSDTTTEGYWDSDTTTEGYWDYDTTTEGYWDYDTTTEGYWDYDTTTGGFWDYDTTTGGFWDYFDTTTAVNSPDGGGPVRSLQNTGGAPDGMGPVRSLGGGAPDGMGPVRSLGGRAPDGMGPVRSLGGGAPDGMGPVRSLQNEGPPDGGAQIRSRQNFRRMFKEACPATHYMQKKFFGGDLASYKVLVCVDEKLGALSDDKDIYRSGETIRYGCMGEEIRSGAAVRSGCEEVNKCIWRTSEQVTSEPDWCYAGLDVLEMASAMCKSIAFMDSCFNDMRQEFVDKNGYYDQITTEDPHYYDQTTTIDYYGPVRSLK